MHDFHCRDGDALPLIPDIPKQAAWRRCSKNVSRLLSFGAASAGEFESPARAEGFAGMARGGHPPLHTAHIRSPAFNDRRNFPPIKSCQSGIGGWKLMRDTTFRRVEI